MKILAVCGFGVGSSMVLKMSLDKVIKELGLKATVENTDLSTAKATMADVYFTSHELLPELKASVKAPVYPILFVKLSETKLSIYVTQKNF
ncbi:PTS sugar transporter subunit IIB [Enterococcus faecium]|nr:PTS sugar transporter subunit IIB [Enterococcus faecium]